MKIPWNSNFSIKKSFIEAQLHFIHVSPTTPLPLQAKSLVAATETVRR